MTLTRNEAAYFLEMAAKTGKVICFFQIGRLFWLEGTLNYL
jgi:hypothetical protein